MADRRDDTFLYQMGPVDAEDENNVKHFVPGTGEVSYSPKSYFEAAVEDIAIALDTSHVSGI